VRCSNLGHTSTHNLFHSRNRVKITSSSRSIFKQMHPNTSPKLENTTQHISCALFTHKRREVVVTLCIRHFLAWKLPLARFAFRAVKVLASLMPRIQSAAAALLTPFRYEFHTQCATVIPRCMRRGMWVNRRTLHECSAQLLQSQRELPVY